MIGGGSTTTRVVGIYMPDMDTHEEAEERVGSTEQKQRERGLAGGELAKRTSLKGSAAHPGRWMLRGLLLTKSWLNAVCDWVARVHNPTAHAYAHGQCTLRGVCGRGVSLSHLRPQAPPEPAEVTGMSEEAVHAAGNELVRFFSLTSPVQKNKAEFVPSQQTHKAEAVRTSGYVRNNEEGVRSEVTTT